MANEKSSESVRATGKAIISELPDMESPLHKVCGLMQVLTSFAAGMYEDDTHRIHQGTVIVGTLRHTQKLLEDVLATSSHHADLPPAWFDELRSAIAVNHAILENFSGIASPATGGYAADRDALVISNAIWALEGLVTHIHETAFSPHEVSGPNLNEAALAPQRH